MSAIRKRGKSWFLDLRVGDQRFRESLKTGDRHVASIKAKIRERELMGADYSKPITIEDFAEEYLKIRARIARIEKAIPRLDVIGLDIIDKLAALREAIKP